MENNLNDRAISAEFVKCKMCAEEKQRYKSGMFPNGKDFRYVDEQGKQWNGKLCPGCQCKKNARRQKMRRAKRKLYVRNFV